MTLDNNIPPNQSVFETFEKPSLSRSVLICPISASDSNFNPQNTQCIPEVKILIFLDLDKKP